MLDKQKFADIFAKLSNLLTKITPVLVLALIFVLIVDNKLQTLNFYKNDWSSINPRPRFHENDCLEVADDHYRARVGLPKDELIRLIGLPDMHIDDYFSYKTKNCTITYLFSENRVKNVFVTTHS